jgi:iron complex transport system substrate-binding protein
VAQIMTRFGTLTFNRFRRLIAALAGVVAASIPGGCAEPAPAQSHSGAPTIVSLNPCLDAILVEVAQSEQILALSHYSRDPAASSIPVATARRFGVTGGTAEEVLALEPDLVLASSFMAPATKAAFERLGLRVETFGSPASIAESIAQVRAVAALTGNRARGEALVRRIARAARPPSTAIPALLWQSDEIVPGEQTLIAEQMRWAGFTNAAAARGLGQGERVSLERLIADPPAVLLIAGDAPGQRHPLLAKRLKEMVTTQLDPHLIYCGGPTIPRARARLLEIRRQYERRR